MRIVEPTREQIAEIPIYGKWIVFLSHIAEFSIGAALIYFFAYSPELFPYVIAAMVLPYLVVEYLKGQARKSRTVLNQVISKTIKYSDIVFYYGCLGIAVIDYFLKFKISFPLLCTLFIIARLLLPFFLMSMWKKEAHNSEKHYVKDYLTFSAISCGSRHLQDVLDSLNDLFKDKGVYSIITVESEWSDDTEKRAGLFLIPTRAHTAVIKLTESEIDTLPTISEDDFFNFRKMINNHSNEIESILAANKAHFIMDLRIHAGKFKREGRIYYREMTG